MARKDANMNTSPERCKKGHVRTGDNTSWVRDTSRNRMRKRCLDCRRDAYCPNGRETVYERAAQDTTYRHEDVEDLIRFGADYHEVIARSGFSSWDTLHRSLKRRGRHDLIEAVLAKRPAAMNADLSAVRVNGGKYTRSSFNLKNL